MLGAAAIAGEAKLAGPTLRGQSLKIFASAASILCTMFALRGADLVRIVQSQLARLSPPMMLGRSEAFQQAALRAACLVTR